LFFSNFVEDPFRFVPWAESDGESQENNENCWM